MTTENRITRLPRIYESDRAAEAAAVTPWASGAVSELITGAASCAPYLHGLILKEHAWLEGALADPEAALAHTLAQTRALTGGDVAAGTRQGKRRVALLSALCDLGGIWALENVTGALSDLADAATHVALRAEVAREIAKGKLPGQVEADIETCGGMVALAMGKHGAHELNYSSDIDLICLFDQDRFEASDQMDARAAFIRATRRAMTTLSEPTGDGYVFRTDLRLRPNPSTTPVCFAMEAAERYYESVGRTWERAAFIKARPAAGDIHAGSRFLDDLSPFVWRRHLDFAAIEEIHDLRRKIRDHKGLGGDFHLEGHNVKLGQGGIREIEFFAQTRQLIAGGRDRELRERGTITALAKLAQKAWIDAKTAQVLSDDYRAHRELEHRLQMMRDQQTHSLPTTPDEFDRLAALMGTDTDTLRADVAQRTERVDAMTEAFFAPTTAPSPQVKRENDFAQITAEWHTYPCLRSERAQTIFDRLKPALFSRLEKLDNPVETLTHLDGFMRGLPAGVQLFSLFDANPPLVDLLLDVASTAPHLARYLSQNSGVLDAVIGGDFFSPWPGVAGLTAALGAQLEAAQDDYEKKLDLSRRWSKEWHFRVGVHHLRDLIGADEAGRQYCDIARACVAALYPQVVAEFARKHGPPPGLGAMVLAMGSLGAGRLTAASDLDMIVIYNADGVEASDGRRPLPARTYYSRLTQALITAMTTQTAEGKLYEVDMRLRPSGNQGPVATSLQSFERYQRDEAWVWEHLALTRATPVAGDDALVVAVEKVRASVLGAPKDDAHVRHETNAMRLRLSEVKPGDRWDPKNGAGRMMDIELIAETAALLSATMDSDVYAQIAAGQRAGWFTDEEAATLGETYRLMWRMQSGARLLTGEKLDPDTIGAGGRGFLARSTGTASLDALADLAATQAAQAAKVIDLVLDRPFGAP
ncbi:glutamine-synthetase adenylyltransferase [Celeribacter arenosi]|uniref:[glutamate--ammonia-ligase] adenylyltransferase n=1 Tax=Celeribacter arenosi TaxID=792649 RepID=A0ABP7KD90_9RHOB